MHTHVKITRVETIPLRIPFKTPFKIASGAARADSEVLLVRLHTNEGLTGIGETQAWRRQGSAETLPGLTAIIRDHFAPHLVGQSPFSIAAILPKLEAAMYHSLYAQAPIADALYDLQGKLLGVPVYELLGGKCGDSLGASAVLTMKPKLAETIAGAAKYYERGYRNPGNHPGTSIATASVAHLAAAWPGELLEGPFAVGLDNLADDVVAEPLRRVENRIRVPDGPGSA